MLNHPYKGQETYEQWLSIEKTLPKIKVPSSMLQSKWVPNLAYIGKRYLDELNIKSGSMLQIGASTRNNEGTFSLQPITHPFYNNLTFYNLDIVDDGSPNTIVGDITKCPQIKDNSYDFICSQDTFEHLKEPWLAAEEITRILKPNGLCFIYTIFSWRYHEVPVDYWRFSPQCLVDLFEHLECLETNWDARNRRGPIQGTSDEIAHDMVPEDELGPWRENWRVYYVGTKNA